MNNTEKLLRAFIEASGFNIETITKTEKVKSFSGGFYRKTSVIGYKVAKKEKTDDVFIDGISLTQYMLNITDLNDTFPAEHHVVYKFIYYSNEVIKAIIKEEYFKSVEKIEGGYLIEGVRVLYEKG